MRRQIRRPVRRRYSNVFWLTLLLLCGFVVFMLIVLLSREGTQPRSRSMLSKIVPLALLSLAKGKKHKKLCVRTVDRVYYVCVKYMNVSFALVFGRAWNHYVNAKGIQIGWHVHFLASSRRSMLYVTEYNLEGMPTSRLYNFGRYAPVCLTYASLQSKHLQILPKRYFDGFIRRDRPDLEGIEKYEVKLHFIRDALRGFCGRNWGDFIERENISEGQRMVFCHAGGFRFNVTVFDFNGVAIETFSLVVVDDVEWFTPVIELDDVAEEP